MNRSQLTVLASVSVVLLGACVSAQSTDSTAVTATETVLPALESMLPAWPTSKISVPADVKYQLSTVPIENQAVTVQVAVVPRVAGGNLRIEFPASDAVVLESGAVASVEQKTAAADVYRRTLVVTPRVLARAEVRVLVSMDVDGGRYFGVFRIPLNPQAIDKNAPVRNQ